MTKEKEQQEISLVGRIICLEALILVMGVISLVYGMVNGTAINIFWGVIILCGAVVLYFVRKKDWTKHWEEQEAIRQRLEERRKREKDGGRP